MATEGHNRKNNIEFSEGIIKANFAEMFRALAATKYCFFSLLSQLKVSIDLWDLSKRCHYMSSEVEQLSACLTYCQELHVRFLNCWKFPPTLSYIFVQLLYILSPNVVCYRVFLPSQNNCRVFSTTVWQCTGFLRVKFDLWWYHRTNTILVQYVSLRFQSVQTRT